MKVSDTILSVTHYLSFTDYVSAIKPLPVVKPNQAIRLKALLDFEDGDVKRKSGDMWQIEGPCTYMPAAEVVSHHRLM